MSYNPSTQFNPWMGSVQDFGDVNLDINDKVDKLMTRNSRRQESNYSFGDPGKMLSIVPGVNDGSVGVITRGNSMISGQPALERSSSRRNTRK